MLAECTIANLHKADNIHCWGSITERLVSGFTNLDSTASLHANNNTLSS